jgi:hypothetical protein
LLQQVDRRNFFARFEIWTSAQTYAAYKNSSTTQAILAQLAPLLEAPLDERDGNLLEGSVTPRSGHAEARQIVVITHLDIIPTFVVFANQQSFDAHVSARTRWTFGAISRRPSVRLTMNGSISSSTGDVTGLTNG